MRVLILGGTTEASRLAEALAGRGDIAALLSFAGRTAHPIAPPIRFRVGGFGGIEGLAGFLKAEQIDAVVDATHPFAARISANAVVACRLLELPLLAFSRAPWQPTAGDRWTPLPDLAAAIRYLAALRPQRVFVTTGRLDLAAYKAAPQHDYLIRTIDPPAPDHLPPNTTLVTGRGPFALTGEQAILRETGISILVTKNSGGDATSAKLGAARTLGVPVVMVARPPAPGGAVCYDIDTALAFIDGGD